MSSSSLTISPTVGFSNGDIVNVIGIGASFDGRYVVNNHKILGVQKMSDIALIEARNKILINSYLKDRSVRLERKIHDDMWEEANPTCFMEFGVELRIKEELVKVGYRIYEYKNEDDDDRITPGILVNTDIVICPELMQSSDSFVRWIHKEWVYVDAPPCIDKPTKPVGYRVFCYEGANSRVVPCMICDEAGECTPEQIEEKKGFIKWIDEEWVYIDPGYIDKDKDNLAGQISRASGFCE